MFEGEKSFVKTLVQKTEKNVINDIRKEGGAFFAFKTAGAGGKAAIIGATVAGVAALGFIANSLFGSKPKDQTSFTAREDDRRTTTTTTAAAR